MHCFVTNPKDNPVYPPELNKDNTLFYPEKGMTTRECYESSKPRDFHIVTDCVDFVSMYEQDEVFIWRNGAWTQPEMNTLGLSHDSVRMCIFNIMHTIPLAFMSAPTNCMGRPINSIKQ